MSEKKLIEYKPFADLLFDIFSEDHKPLKWWRDYLGVSGELINDWVAGKVFPLDHLWAIRNEVKSRPESRERTLLLKRFDSIANEPIFDATGFWFNDLTLCDHMHAPAYAEFEAEFKKLPFDQKGEVLRAFSRMVAEFKINDQAHDAHCGFKLGQFEPEVESTLPEPVVECTPLKLVVMKPIF